MGLCKCRKVSNLFCFEHRANVCEHCMIKDHPKCIVRSYLQWLQDSEFSSECRLCRQPLAAADVLRLPCYDVFHWHCLAKHFAALPAHTAPAGYTCPTCESRAIPTDSMSGPVVDAVRQAFSDTAWGAVTPRAPAKPSEGDSKARPAAAPSPAHTGIDMGAASYHVPAHSGQYHSSSFGLQSKPQFSTWVTRLKRRLGIRPLRVMGRDFSRLAVVLALFFLAMVLWLTF